METGEEVSKLYLITALFKEVLCNAVLERSMEKLGLGI